MVLVGKNPRNSSNPVPWLKTHENRNRFSILISVGFLGSNLDGTNLLFSVGFLGSNLDGTNLLFSEE